MRAGLGEGGKEPSQKAAYTKCAGQGLVISKIGDRCLCFTLVKPHVSQSTTFCTSLLSESLHELDPDHAGPIEDQIDEAVNKAISDLNVAKLSKFRNILRGEPEGDRALDGRHLVNTGLAKTIDSTMYIVQFSIQSDSRKNDLALLGTLITMHASLQDS